MNLLHFCEQCQNYNCELDSDVQIKRHERGGIFEELSAFNSILFLQKGEISCSWGSFVNFPMHERQMMYLPANYRLIYSTHSQSTLVFIKLYYKIQFCDQHHLENLAVYYSNGYKSDIQTPYLLRANDILNNYASHLIECVKSGLRCKTFLLIKIKELLFLLGTLYTTEELAFFFRDAMSYDSSFSHYVIQNSYKYQSLSELADAMNLTVSGIEKRFKKVFGISGYKWMIEQKVNKLFHVICSSDYSFKEISEDFGFSSKSTFNDFCKRHLGKTPGEIRQKFTPEESLKNK